MTTDAPQLTPTPTPDPRGSVSEALARFFDACWQDPHRRPVMEQILAQARAPQSTPPLKEAA